MSGRVLVVDDVPQNVKLLEAKLSAEYYTPIPAFNGKEALEKAASESPDIILLDVMMPEMDGFEACRHLKSTPETSHIPVVMVTALSDSEDRVQGLSSGADDFITKPIDEVHLLARVKSLIRLKVMQDELRMRDKTGMQFGLSAEPIKPDEHVNGTIMLVDDDIVESRNIINRLSAEGHTIDHIPPNKVMEHVLDKTYDLVLTSAMLDEEDGLRLDMQIRSQEKTRHIPLMIMVDRDNKPQLVKALEMGIDDYILAPVDSNELVARVNTQVKRKNYQDRLRSSYQESLTASVIDSLTKLYNRRYLDAHLQNILEEALRDGKELAIMTLDIDHFKQVNDKPGWGHHIGDEVLVEVAERIKNNIRSTDLATRPGGEEFVIVMPKTGLGMAEVIAERIRISMADNPFIISAEPGSVTCTVSIGVTSLKKDGDTVADLLKRSDEALYKAKNSGRNRVVSSDQEVYDGF